MNINGLHRQDIEFMRLSIQATALKEGIAVDNEGYNGPQSSDLRRSVKGC